MIAACTLLFIFLLSGSENNGRRVKYVPREPLTTAVTIFHIFSVQRAIAPGTDGASGSTFQCQNGGDQPRVLLAETVKKPNLSYTPPDPHQIHGVCPPEICLGLCSGMPKTEPMLIRYIHFCHVRYLRMYEGKSVILLPFPLARYPAHFSCCTIPGGWMP